MPKFALFKICDFCCIKFKKILASGVKAGRNIRKCTFSFIFCRHFKPRKRVAFDEINFILCSYVVGRKPCSNSCALLQTGGIQWSVHVRHRQWKVEPACRPHCPWWLQRSEDQDSSRPESLVHWGVTVLYDFSKIYREISTVRGEQAVCLGKQSGRLPSKVHDASHTEKHCEKNIKILQ